MKRRPSFLQRVWRKLRGTRPAPAAKPVTGPLPKRVSSLEPLEGRIAPASLINPTTLMYKDIDGDIVTVKLSKALFTGTLTQTPAGLANEVFQFSTGNVVAGAFDATTAVEQQLRLIDFTEAPIKGGSGSVAKGVSLTITAAPGLLVPGGPAGDGFAHVGFVDSGGIALGSVSIDGDLGQIDAGAANVKTAITALKVQTLGAKGLTTQAAGGSLVSNIVGGLGSFTVLGDMKDASVRVANGTDFDGNITAPGRIGSIKIGGSLVGTAATGTASDVTGLIDAPGGIGSIRIGTTASDGIVGGGGNFSGAIFTSGNIGSVTISGGITGSAGANSGTIRSLGNIGAMKIGTVPGVHDLKGGAGEASGSIIANGTIASLFVGGDVKGDLGKSSGIISAGVRLGATIIAGDLAGGGGMFSGVVEGGTVVSISVSDAVLAGAGEGSGVISSSGALGSVKIGGDVDGLVANAGLGAGGIRVGGKLGSVTIDGDLRGGGGVRSGFIWGFGDIGAVRIGEIVGGSALNAGTVIAGGKLASLTVAGSITGGTAAGAGSVFSGFDAAFLGDMGAVKIGGSLVGGSAASAGTIESSGRIASVTIGPAIAGDQVLLQGGAGDFSGAIFGHGGMGAVRINGHVEGGGGDFSGAIVSRDRIDFDRAGDLGAVVVTGHLQGGTGDDSGLIRADGKLTSATLGALLGGDGDRSGALRAGQGQLSFGNTGAIAIKGVLTGGAGDQAGGVVTEGRIASIIVSGDATNGTIRAGDDIAALTFSLNVNGTTVAARGQAVQGAATDLAIGRITVGGDVTNTKFLAGYDTALVAANADAQIGAVKVNGNWTASDLVAGVLDGGAAGFGTDGDVKIGGFDNARIVSSIASIVIGGAVTGTEAAGDHFGFTAQKIGAFKALGVPAPQPPLNALADGQSFDAVTGEVTIREIPLPVPA